MSANLDLVRSIYADWKRGDYGSAEWAHSGTEYVHADGPEPGSRTGRAGRNNAQLGAFAQLRSEPEEYHELDAERVLVLVRASGQGKMSALPIDQKGAEVFEIHGGKVTRIIVYFDPDRALADLGLAPDGEPAASPRVDAWREAYEGWARDS
jgi:ketosteroid isomerase-like protein